MSFTLHAIDLVSADPGRRIVHWIGDFRTLDGRTHRNGGGYFIHENPSLPVYAAERFVTCFSERGERLPGIATRIVGWTHDPNDPTRLCAHCGTVHARPIEHCSEFEAQAPIVQSNHHPAASALLSVQWSRRETSAPPSNDHRPVESGALRGWIHKNHHAATCAALDAIAGHPCAPHEAHVFAAARLDAHRVYHHHANQEG